MIFEEKSVFIFNTIEKYKNFRLYSIRKTTAFAKDLATSQVFLSHIEHNKYDAKRRRSRRDID